MTSKLRDVRFMLHIDGLERLYENRVGETDNPFVPVFGPAGDPFGFIREIKGSKSILVVLGYRDWGRESIRKALVRSKITNNKTLRYAIDWPTETRVSSVITRTISESKIGGEGHHASEIAAKLMRDFSMASPSCAQHLQGVLATAGSENELDGYLSDTVENYYQSLPDEIKGGVARIVQRFPEGARTLPAREVANDPHLWSIANKWRTVDFFAFLDAHLILLNSAWFRVTYLSLGIARLSGIQLLTQRHLLTCVRPTNSKIMPYRGIVPTATLIFCCMPISRWIAP